MSADQHNTGGTHWGVRIEWEDGTVEYDQYPNRDRAESAAKLRNRPDQGKTATLVSRLVGPWAVVEIPVRQFPKC